MKKTIQILTLLFSAALIIALTSCGGGGGSDDTGSGTTNTTLQSTGTVGILLTDKPADLSVFESINATIESVELLGGDDEASKVTIYSGPPKTYDLLKLTHEAIPFTFKDEVPVGTYCKIRLTLEDLELVLKDGTTEHPKLPGNGKLDLVARNCFDVGPGEVVMLQIDIDAGNSIHIVENKKGYNFRPVVFVDVLSESFSGKLIRIKGKITERNEDLKSLLLCDVYTLNVSTPDVSSPPYTKSDSLGCIEVYFDDKKSAFFDNKSFDGMPRPLNELFYIDIGEVISIVGWPRHSVQSSPDGVVEDPYRPDMELNALVAELGDFLTLNGDVTVDADSSGFYMNVRKGEPILAGSPIDVVLQGAPAGGNGTRIVSKSGLLLDYESIEFPKMVQVDGTLDLDTDLLYAALVIVDTKSSETEKVTGTILEVNPNSLLLTPDTETVCGVTVDQITVGYSSETDFFTVVIDEPVTIIPGDSETLEPGQYVGLSISCAPPVYSAETIIIIDEQSP